MPASKNDRFAKDLRLLLGLKFLIQGKKGKNLSYSHNSLIRTYIRSIGKEAKFCLFCTER